MTTEEMEKACEIQPQKHHYENTCQTTKEIKVRETQNEAEGFVFLMRRYHEVGGLGDYPEHDVDVVRDARRDLLKACTIIDKQNEELKAKEREHIERENIFQYLNEKQFPYIGGICLDKIIQDLGQCFEQQAEQLKAKDVLLERQSLLMGELQCKLEQALKANETSPQETH